MLDLVYAVGLLSAFGSAILALRTVAGGALNNAALPRDAQAAPPLATASAVQDPPRR